MNESISPKTPVQSNVHKENKKVQPSKNRYGTPIAIAIAAVGLVTFGLVMRSSSVVPIGSNVVEQTTQSDTSVTKLPGQPASDIQPVGPGYVEFPALQGSAAQPAGAGSAAGLTARESQNEIAVRAYLDAHNVEAQPQEPNVSAVQSYLALHPAKARSPYPNKLDAPETRQTDVRP